MIRSDQDNFCAACRTRQPDVEFVKFPAVDNNQYQEFCKPCRAKFYAWKNGKLSISKVFDRNFKLQEHD